MSIKANSHSCSHLLLKNLHAGSGLLFRGLCNSITPPLTIEWLGWLSGSTFERCQIIKTRRLDCKLSISCAKHILFLLWPRSNWKCAKIIMAAKTKDYSPRHARVIRLRPACIQRKTHVVLRAAAYWLSYFSLFCFVAPG